MPMYEYTCPSCGHAFEKLVRSASKADTITCPNCETLATRQMSTFAVKASGGAGISLNSAPAPSFGGG